ncbi:hypothetical protein AAFF_G00238550 [Aldrovandia affinis]|uniref:Fibronectin type-III domain-containing protein n=1 Tax=Aldrovandia affinis TaxID=143900 RepID=A0AAD7RED7_9TELE|nr:hypothetical protein AAFF_G00238550 [Aldrovandia affinis]
MGITGHRTARFLAVLVGVCAAAAEHGLSPKLGPCVLMQSANITCSWEPAQDTPPGTSYTLQVNEMGDDDSVFDAKDCRTEQTHCHVRVLTMSALYCISVTAHHALGNASSAPLCRHGTTIVKLYAPVFSRFLGVLGQPYCLQTQWVRPSHLGLPYREVSAGVLHYQLEYTTEERVRSSVDLRTRQTELCLFSPFTLYTARIRWRYNRTAYWSDWSSAQQARTEEAAPSVALQIWRWVEPAGAGEWRRATLLWKPLARRAANGVVLGYNVSCREEGGPPETTPGECGDLRPSDTSCRLPLAPRRRSCNVSAFNAAGFSPAALIAIPAAWDTEGVEPEVRYTVSVSALYGQDVGEELAVQTYSREGAPSAGPGLHVTELGSSSVALRWEPIALGQRHGFIKNYTLYWQDTGGHAKRVFVPRDQRWYTLTGLSGRYRIYLVAHTNSGATAGQAISVDLEHGSLSVWTILCCCTLTLFTMLVVLSCLKHRERVRLYLCPKVPDPAKSSLSVWSPGVLWGDTKSLHAQDCLKPPRLASEMEPQGRGDCQHPLVVTPMLQCGLEGFDLAEGGYVTVPAPPTPGSGQSQSGVGVEAHPHTITNLSYWVSHCSYASLCVSEPALPRPATAPHDEHGRTFKSQDGLPLLRDLDTFPLLLQFLQQDAGNPRPAYPMARGRHMCRGRSVSGGSRDTASGLHTLQIGWRCGVVKGQIIAVHTTTAEPTRRHIPRREAAIETPFPIRPDFGIP